MWGGGSTSRKKHVTGPAPTIRGGRGGVERTQRGGKEHNCRGEKTGENLIEIRKHQIYVKIQTRDEKKEEVKGTRKGGAWGPLNQCGTERRNTHEGKKKSQPGGRGGRVSKPTKPRERRRRKERGGKTPIKWKRLKCRLVQSTRRGNSLPKWK